MKKATWLLGIFAISALLLVAALLVYAEVPTFASAADPPLRLVDSPRSVAVVRAASPVACAQSDPPSADVILETAISAMDALDTWHFETWLDMIVSYRSIAFETPLIFVGDFQSPDRLEGTASVQLLGITLERDAVLFARTLDAADPATGPAMGSVLSLLDFARFDMADIQDLELVGEEDLEGTRVYHLAGRLPTQKRQSESGKQQYTFEGELRFDLWIGVDDRLPRQAVIGADLATTGPAEGSINVAGSATWSNFGQPLAAGAASTSTSVGTACSAFGEGFVAYNDPARAISFCYPAGWVVDDLVGTSGFYAVSPTGTGSGRPLPKSMVVIYPPQVVAGFGHWLVGSVEIFARPALHFYPWVREAIQPGSMGGFVLNHVAILEIAQWILADGPLFGGLAGTQYPGAKAVSLGGAVDNDLYGPTVEAVINSVVVGAGTQR